MVSHPKKNQQISATFTPEQIQAIESAFTDVPEAERPNLSEMVRSLVAGGLSLYQIKWPLGVEQGKHSKRLKK